MKKIKEITVQKWLPLEDIFENGIIKINKNKYIKILKIIPINYNLKSDLEKKTILNSYKILLKTCNFDIQILIQSNKEDLSQHILNIRKNIQKEENKYLKELSENYIKFIQNLNYSKNSATKDFYIIITNEKIENFNSIEIIENDLKEKYFKIKECLSRCGNDVIEINNKKEKINNFISGIFSKKDLISPAYINMQNPKYIEIDNLFYSSLLVVNYYREQNDLLLKNLIETNMNMNISIFYEKQDSYKTIKDLTYHIGNVGVEVKDSNQNRQDIEIASYTYNDAKYIRKEMQVNNEDLYYLYIYIILYSDNIKELEYNLNKIEGITQSKGMQTRRGNFRQEECFLATLPIMENKEIIKEATKRNILTTGLLSTYPFISSSIFDKDGIFIGTNIYNNSLVFIDRYNTEKYKNANICIFGTSGAGKSFYTKLLILRYKLLGIKQYIIDPDREYNKICEKLKGIQIKLGPTSNTYINILDIRKESIEEGENGYLATKIGKLIGFFNLIFGEMDEEEKAVIEEKIIEVNKIKNITFDDKSLYKENKKFKSEKEMPILEDLYNILGKDEKTKKFKIKLIPFVEGSMKFFNNYTNIKLDNDLIVADIYDLGEENLKYGMYLFTDIFWDKIKEKRDEKKAIYLDEIWRLIRSNL